MSPKATLVSLHFDATYASSLQPCRSVSSPHVYDELQNQAPRLSFHALQHLRIKVPFLSLPVIRKRMEYIALYPKSPTPRVWLPSLWRQLLSPLETSFSSQRSWASPFKAFLLSHGRIILSNDPSAPALSYKTLPGLVPALQRLTPTGKAVLLLSLSGRLIRIGATCSLGLSDLLGPLHSLTHEVSVSLTSSPSRS